MPRHATPIRAPIGRGLVAICVLTTVGTMSARSAPIASAVTSGAPFAHTITELAELVLCVVSCWLAVATALLVAGSVLGTASLPARLGVRVTPLAWRRLLAVALGGAIVLAPAATDAATPGGDEPRIAGLRLPDRPSGRPPPDGRAAVGTGVVSVRPGDTLWDLASSRLPPGADNTARAAACARWYAANRHVIGADPDLLLPGTRLQVPSDPHERTIR